MLQVNGKIAGEQVALVVRIGAKQMNDAERRPALRFVDQQRGEITNRCGVGVTRPGFERREGRQTGQGQRTDDFGRRCKNPAHDG